MDKENGKSPLITISALVALFTAFGVLIYTHIPLRGIRPSVPEIYEPSQRVRARLWEDPFLAVMKQVKAKDRSPPSPAGRIFLMEPEKVACEPTLTGEIRKRLEKEKEEVTVLGVMVLGGPYEEDMEHRLRQRYAVLSALRRVRFTPEDSEHIGYLRVFQNVEGIESQISLNTLMPFEWLISDTGKKSVLLLWINEYSFYSKPLSKLNSLITSLRPQNIENDAHRELSFKIIGPVQSDTLLQMIEEKTQLEGDQEEQEGGTITVNGFRYSVQLSKLKIFSPSATAEGQVLLKEVENKICGDPPTCVQDLFKQGKIKIQFHQIICTDDSLCRILLNELKERGVGPEDYIVLVAEWDTFYGRQLPKTFRKVREEMRKKDKDGSGTRVIRFSYLRGIDGKLPGESDRSADKDSKNGGNRKEREDIRTGEEPEGKSQYDYLRRLAETVCSHEQEKGEIKAIGVLGSDFHDKYLVLQALGQRFPEKIFFTTDLDARLIHPANIKWTRNLLVASGFDLQLQEEFQRETPPFRDSYQTSAYLATLKALDCSELGNYKTWPPPPRIFEIGRYHAIDLTQKGKGDLPPVNQALPPANWPRLNRSLLTTWLPLSLISLATLMLISYASTKYDLIDLVRGPWQFIKEFKDLIKRNKVAFLLGLWSILILGLFTLFFILKNLQELALEPFFLSEGISLWPTEIIRLVAVICSLIFLFMAWFRLKKNQDHLTQDFALGDKNEGKQYSGTHSGRHASSLNMDDVWKGYVAQGGWWPRFLRFFPVMVVYGGVCIAIVFTFGKPFRPFRGSATGILDLFILILSIFFFLLLTFFVLDAVMTCRSFVTHCLGKEVEWSDSSKEAFMLDPTEGERGQSEWMLIRLLSKHTEVVGKLIFFPLIVWFLLFLARVSYFDKWPTPIGLLVVIFLGALLPWGYAVMLRRSAEKLRTDVVDRLSKKLIQAKEPPERLKNVLNEVKSARTGAFAPYLQSPIVQSLVVPFGGVGIVQLIEYLSKLN